MNKKEAVMEIYHQGLKGRYSPASAKRAYRACRTIGLIVADSFDVLKFMEYADELLRNVPDLAALPELGEAEVKGDE